MVVAVLILAVGTAAADTSNKAEQLARQYSRAQALGDQPTKARLYDQIVTDTALVQEIRDHHKNTYALLKLEETSRRLEKMQRRYGSKQGKLRRVRTNILTSGATKDSINSGSRSRKLPDNRSFSQNFANQNRAANRVRSSRSNSRIRATNGSAARSFSNSARVRAQSNQRRMRQGR